MTLQSDFIPTIADLPAEIRFAFLSPQQGGGYIINAYSCADGTSGCPHPEKMYRTEGNEITPPIPVKRPRKKATPRA